MLAGDFYHPEMESVPEQTWSSAGLLRAAVEGMLGLEPLPAAGMLRFSPHLPAEWSALTLRNVRVGGSVLALTLTRTGRALTLLAQNAGPPAIVDFAPALPLRAHLHDALEQSRD